MSSAQCLENDWYFFGRLVGHSGPGRTLERNSRTQRVSASLDTGLDVLEGHDNRLNLGVSYSRSEGNVNQPAEYAYRKFLAFRGYGGPDCGVDVVADPASPSGMALGPTGGRTPGQGNCRFYNPFSNALQFSQQPGAPFVGEPNPDFSPGPGERQLPARLESTRRSMSRVPPTCWSSTLPSRVVGARWKTTPWAISSAGSTCGRSPTSPAT